MHVELVAMTKGVNRMEGFTTEQMLDRIASQSRIINPMEEEPREGLFKDTIKWRHESIQEFVDYTFHIKNVSRVLLAQLTRHRIASYNVSSQRHIHPQRVIVPEKIDHGYATIVYFNDNGEEIFTEWKFDSSGKFEAINKNYGRVEDIPLEDIRMLFPSAVTVNLFMKMNGRSLRNFIKLRTSEHAQWEIRELASKICAIVEQDCPTLLDRLDLYKEMKDDIEILINTIESTGDPVDFSSFKMKWGLN